MQDSPEVEEPEDVNLDEFDGEEAEGPKLPKGMTKTTQGAHGRQLLIGVVEGTKLEKDFEFKPFTWKEEKRIDQLRNEKGGSSGHTARVVLDVLAHMLTRWGSNEDFQALKHRKRVEILDQQYLEDILYAYICLRVETMGELMQMQITCQKPFCEHEFPWDGDLSALSITTTNLIPQPIWFQLRKQVTRAGKRIDALAVEPPRWRAMTELKTGSALEADVKRSLAFSGIAKVRTADNEIIAASKSMMDSMMKLDVSRLVRLLESNDFAGTDTRVSWRCPECGTRVITTMTWGYDFLFSSASLPEDIAP